MDKYVRIVGYQINDIHVTRYLGTVGTVVSYEDKDDGNGTMFLVLIDKFAHLFHEWNIQHISKKEYFKGCLSG